MALKRNIFSNMLGQVLLMLLSLVSTHLVFRNLGSDVLGVLYFSVTITFVLITLSDMGLSPTITREIAAHRQRDQNYMNDLAGSMSALAWTAYMTSCVVVAMLSPFLIHRWLQFDGVPPENVVMSFEVISASLLLAIPRSVYGAVIAGNERMDLWNIANVAAVGLQQGGMILVVGFGGALQNVAMWYVVSGVGGLGIFMAIAAYLCGLEALRPVWRWHAIKRNLRFGAGLFANTVVGYLVGQSDKWIVSKLLSASMLGYYGVAQSLVSKGGMVPGAIASAAFPAFSTGVANQARSDWTVQYHKLQDLCGYMYVPVSAAVAMLGIVVMRFVLNEEAVLDTWLPLVFLAIGQFFLGLQYVPYMLSLAMKKPEISLRANLQTFGLAIPLAIFLTFQYGLAGASFSTVVSSLMHMLLFIPRFSSECLVSDGLKWFRVSGVLTVLGFLSYGMPWTVLWVMDRGLDTYGLIVAYLFGTALFVLSGWSVMGAELKNLVRSQVRSLRASLVV